MLLSQMTDQIGRVLGGRYRLVAPIGTGSSAQVFLADDTRLKRRVAVKVLHPALADDQTFLRRFRAEAQASAKLSHPNIVILLDSGNDPGPYLVTEFVSGGSLRAMLDQGHRLSVAQALVVGLEAARGLDFAHRQGFVHRDIKPANLLFGDDGRLRIADFGVARALAEAAWTEPSGAVLGTARYASPEQAQGQPVTGRGDIYSLALVLVESVTGQVPFAADTTIGTLMARIDKHMDLTPELGELREVLENAGDPDPDERPDAAEMAARFVRLAEELDAPEPLPLAGAFLPDDLAPFVDPDPTHLPAGGEGIIVLGGAADEGDAGGGPKPSGRLRAARDSLAERRLVRSEPSILLDENYQPDEPDPPAAVAITGATSSERRAGDTADGPVLSTQGRRVPVPALVAGAVVLLALIVGAGLLVREVTRPQHEVPAAQGLTIDDLPALIEGNGWTVEEVSARQDGTRPGEIIDQDPREGAKLREGHTLQVTVSRGQELVAVPDELSGLTQGEADAALEAVGLRAGAIGEKWGEFQPAGMVLGESMIYTEVPSGTRVPLVVSKGPKPRAIPEGLSGGTFEQAKADVESVQLVAIRSDDFSETVPEGQVIGTNPSAGTEVPRDSEVVVVVSKGPEPVIIPDLTSDSVDEAQAALEALGLVVGSVDGPLRGIVTGTDPAAGMQVNRGASVSIVTRGRGTGNNNND